MDNQRDQQGTQAGQPAMAQPADPMTSAMPGMTSQMPVSDGGAATAPAGMPPVSSDPMAAPSVTPGATDAMGSSMPPVPAPQVDGPVAPAPTGMDAMASGMSAMPSADSMAATMPATPADSMSAPAAAGSASLDDVMAELRKIEDKLVEMDEKL